MQLLSFLGAKHAGSRLLKLLFHNCATQKKKEKRKKDTLRDFERDWKVNFSDEMALESYSLLDACGGDL